MSLLGALSTAVSGLAGQTASFSDISDNVANSQTTGFKRIDTTFADYLTDSTALINESGSVIARPSYQNNVQGSVVSNDNPLSFAISGSGLFSVSRATQDINGVTTFASQTYYTRAGDFQLNKEGYLVNSNGDYLNGWKYDSTTNTLNRNAVAPIQVTQTTDSPVATSTMNLSANLPNNDGSGIATTQTSTVDVYDAQGASHTLTMQFVPQSTLGLWQLNVTDDGTAPGEAGTPATIGTAQVQFAADGTLQTVNGNATTTLTLGSSYPVVPSGTQQISLNLGSNSGSAGLTQFAGTEYTLRGITQNGVPPGSFKSLTNDSSGDIIANFDNGQSRIVARAPVITFPDPNQLQRQDGSAFSASVAAGDPLAHDAGTGGAGNLVTSATEASNVDISSEFTKLIVAQQAYSANAKLITTGDDMLTTTINMKR